MILGLPVVLGQPCIVKGLGQVTAGDDIFHYSEILMCGHPPHPDGWVPSMGALQ